MKKDKLFWFPFWLILLEVSIYLSNDMYVTGLPSMVKDFGTTQDFAQYTLTAWFLGSASLQLILGPLSDVYGKRITILSGGILFIISSFFCAITEDLNILLIMRFLQGAAVCFIFAGYALIHEFYSGKQVIKIISVMTAVTVLAPALGPLLGAFIIEYVSWRYIFWFLFVSGIVSLAGLSFVTPHSHNLKEDLKFGEVLKQYINILTNKQFLRFNMIFCFLVVSFFIWIVETPFIFIDVLNMSEMFFGVAQVFVFGGFILGTQITNYFITDDNVSSILRVSFIGSMIWSILLYVTSKYSGDVYLVNGLMSLLSISCAMSFGPLNRLTMEASEEPMGIKAAVFSMLIGLFGGGGTVILTFVNNKSFEIVSLIILVCVAIGITLHLTNTQEIKLKKQEDS